MILHDISEVIIPIGIQAHGLQEEIEDETGEAVEKAKPAPSAAADDDEDSDDEGKKREKQLNNDIESQITRLMEKAVCLKPIDMVVMRCMDYFFDDD